MQLHSVQQNSSHTGESNARHKNQEDGPGILVGSGAALEAIHSGEIDIQIATARRWPRKISKCLERVLELACKDTETAQSCFYKYMRAGKPIEGPGIRMAEIVAASWQKLRVQGRVMAIKMNSW